MKQAALFVLILLLLTAMIQEKENKVCFKGHCFSVELAKTKEERERGLMFRESLGEEEGMLFLYETEGRSSFWMKNVLIPLDIIWINKEKEVVFIERAQPCQEGDCPLITPFVAAKYVLEIKGGLSKEMGLSLGDKLEITYSD